MSSITTAKTDQLPSSSMASTWHYARHPPADITDTNTFKGKTVLVTGANTGLGFQAALKYAKLGASVLALAVRSTAKGEEAKAEILRLSDRRCIKDDPRAGIDIRIFTVDMSTFDSVKSLIAALNDPVSGVAHIDVALMNAGLAAPSFRRSPEGHEMAVQVNVLSSALMGILLLPKLRSSATKAAAQGESVHLTFVNSLAHAEAERKWIEDGKSLWEATNMDEKSFDVKKAYYLVKLLAMVAIQRIATATREDEGLIVNSCCPGLCRTSLGRDFSPVAKIFMNTVHSVLARSAEEGSRTLVGATALGPDSHGGFWIHDKLSPKGPLLEEKQLMDDAWKSIFKILEETAPEVGTILDESQGI